MFQKERPHIGGQGAQRFQKNKRQLASFVRMLPEISVHSGFGDKVFYQHFARGLEAHFHLPSETLSLSRFTSTTYRKTTYLSRIDKEGQPWLLLKVFSEDQLGHQSLRALRENDGAKAFGKVAGVIAPTIVDVFAFSGRGFPRYNLAVAETILPGKPALYYLERAAEKQEEERVELLGKMTRAFESSAIMLSRVHSMLIGGSLIEAKTIFGETVEILSWLTSVGVFTQRENHQIVTAIKSFRDGSQTARVVLAHRDYTSNNMMFDLAEESMGIIDFEKSENECAAKDLAKFTESLFVDGRSIGLSDDEIGCMQQSFLEAYQYFSDVRSPEFWQQLAFYQIYSALSFARYQVKKSNTEQVLVLKERILSLLP
ncbi:hypothetical protein A3J44_00405 [candidate division WOR-1 bacterium RIFCSPHIGHO2_02_FULL_45_12]|nr:MAG: hypothetical protein A3J44_00405 [candidate division WOR-1 bacterium RIFCSPHIGHO2_02_FULL_45_12]